MPDQTKALAVILARGGSKGIPGKNVIEISGVPLIGRTVGACKRCPDIAVVAVSTNDETIASVARNYGAEIIERPRDLATDSASSEVALLHACKYWQERTGVAHEVLLLAQNTSPFHDPSDMTQVIEKVRSGACNSCITVCQTWRYFWEEGQDGWHMPYQHRANRQNRPPWHMEAGLLYCVRRQLFLDTGNLFAPPVGTVQVPDWRALELDEPEDVKIAEALCRVYAR